MAGVTDNILACRKALDAVSSGVEILAVTKNRDAQTANLAYGAGIRAIGENRVQELVKKLPDLDRRFSVELIGQLQTNKAKYIAPIVSRVQSLDRMPLAMELDRRCQMAGLVMPCLVEVNVAGQENRGGVSPEDVLPFIREASKLKGIRIEGLMAVAPPSDDPEDVRQVFRDMRALFVRLQNEAVDNVEMKCLSMGMSHDYLVAAQEGATMVRLGSILFA